MTPPDHRRARAVGVANALLIGLAGAAALFTVYVFWLHLTEVRQHRINVRWAASVSDADRRAFEQRTTLTAVREGERRTWSYRLRDQSRENIRRIVQSPLVEDTDQIDRREFQIQLSWPGRPPWLRQLAEAQQLPFAGAALLLLALGATWRSKATIIAGVHALRRAASAVATLLSSRSPSRNTPVTRRELLAGLGLGALFLVPLLRYGPYDAEIVQATVFPNQVFYHALFHGQWLFWFDNLGFGTPFPIGDPFSFHPVFGLLAGIGAPLRLTLSALWAAHTAVMVVYFLRVGVVSGIHAPLRLVLLGCYLLSTTTITYFYDNDWVQMAMTWTLLPVLLFYLHDAIHGGAGERFWFTTMRLAALFGFWIVNSHPGHVVPLVLVLAIYTVVAAPANRTVYGCLVAAGALCGVVAMSRVYFLFGEMRQFGTQASSIREATSAWSYISALGLTAAGRRPFIGVGFAIALIASALQVHGLRNAHQRGCVVAALAAVALGVVPYQLLPGLSGWLFRDGMVFFGIVAAGHTLQRWLGARSVWAAAAVLLLAAQGYHQWKAVVAPSIAAFNEARGRLLFYQHQGRPTGLGAVVVRESQQYGRRIYLSPRVERLMRGGLSKEGLHFSSDLALLGLDPVNGWFKNVSMEPLVPAQEVMESLIQGDWNAIENRSLLDVLGIDLVLTASGEKPPPEGLRVAARFKGPSVPDTILVLGNRDAWPRASMLKPDAYALNLPVRTGCGHDAALCRDYGPLVRSRLPDAVMLDGANGRYVARVPPSSQERLLFLSVYYRPEWKAASSSGLLAVHPVAGAFLGVSVPAGVTEVRLRYAPRAFQVLTLVSSLAFVGLLVSCVALSRLR